MPAADLTVHGGTHLRGRKGEAGESRLRPLVPPKGTTTRFFQRLRDENTIAEFVVINPVDTQAVFTHGPNGEQYRWGCRDTWTEAWGHTLIFYPHPAYTGGPVIYVYGPACKPFRMYAEPTTTFHEMRV